ncbi:MAG: helix-turn-helix transcriptional regulator [Candidatus Schekmanbacteria bacterium]|nr:helix-turn-helix transcriptional regulator [Candidatus Schekmanbacteria bacterium]
MSKHRDNFLKRFGNRIRIIRQKKNLSQEELAQIAGLDRTYMGGIERGERNIGLLNVKKLADALKITPKDLFDDDFQL